MWKERVNLRVRERELERNEIGGVEWMAMNE